MVALEWGDRRHVYAWEDAATGRRQTGSIEHTPEAVASWVAQLRQRFGGVLAGVEPRILAFVLVGALRGWTQATDLV